jgi:hypothetical protein
MLLMLLLLLPQLRYDSYYYSCAALLASDSVRSEQKLYKDL